VEDQNPKNVFEEEFYEITGTDFEISELNLALLKWEEVYNTVRVHQTLGYLTL